MGSRWSQVVVDALDPVRLGHWWAEVLGFQVLSEAPDELVIGAKEDLYPQLCFLAVPDPKDGKNRLHLDLTPSDQDAEVERLLDILVQVLIAVFIAVSLDPAVRWLIQRRVRRGQAVAIILFAFVVVLGVFLLAFLPPLIRQGNRLVGDFPGYVNGLRAHSPSLRSLEDRFNLQKSIEDFARTVPAKLGHQALSFGQRFLGALLSTLLILALTIYF